MIAEALRRYGLNPLTPTALQQLEAYLDLLLFWNSRQNLTAIRDRAGIIERHIVESVFCAQELSGVGTLLDFGSGAGLPGIPISILRPDIQVTLGESQGKKAAFLREAIRTVQLTATVHAGRVETLPVDQVFDCVTMRAVDKTREVLPHAWIRVRNSGSLIVFGTTSSASQVQDALPQASWSSLTLAGPLADGLLLIAKK